MGSYFLHKCGDKDAAPVDPKEAVLCLSIMERKAPGSLLEEQISEAKEFYELTLLLKMRHLVVIRWYGEAPAKLLQANGRPQDGG